MATGDLFQPGFRYPLIRSARVDATQAARMVLAAFLRRQLFVIGAGDDGKETPFNLKAVTEQFPTNSDLKYPSASITIPTSDQQAHNFTPKPLEETWNRYAPNSVLWKTAELVADFQVDFFTNDEPTQQAIAGALPAIFNPREGAAGVMVEGVKEYWCLPPRFTLMGDPERFGDTEEAVFAGERRLLVKVRAELDVVHLRGAAALRRPVGRMNVLDPKG